MRITGDTQLFFDASVLVAGAHSKTGGSALLLEACKLGGFKAQVSSLVIMEATHVLERDFPHRSVARLYLFLAEVDWQLVPVPSGRRLKRYSSLIDAKDLHVLAAAVEGGSDFLLTLDRRHVLAAAERVEETGISIEILTPGAFIRKFYPLHEAYPSLPPRGDE